MPPHKKLKELAAKALSVPPESVTIPWSTPTAIHIGAIWVCPNGSFNEYRSIEISLNRCRDANFSEDSVHDVLTDVLEGILRRRKCATPKSE